MITAARTSTRPEGALATGMVLVTVAYPFAWAALNNVDFAPYWAYQSPGITLVLAAAAAAGAHTHATSRAP